MLQSEITSNEARIRRSLDVEKPERIQDTLARLLEGKSACVAVVIIEGKIFIAANELNRHSRDNEITGLIDEVMGYFISFAQNKPIAEEKKNNLLYKILLESSKGVTKGNIPIAEDILQSILVKKKASNTRREDVTIMSLLAKYRENAIAASLAHGILASVERDFCKLEDYIRRADSALEPLVMALKSGNGYEILKESPLPTDMHIHAEAQVLEKIIKLLAEKAIDFKEPQKIYIGLSKLCCLHCRLMLEMANEAFEKQNISLTLHSRGFHDIDFVWHPPSIFAAGYEYGEKTSNAASHNLRTKEPSPEEKQSIAFMIGEKTAESVSKFIGMARPTVTSMTASPSNSDPETWAAERKNNFIMELTSLQAKLKVLPQPTIYTNMQLIDMVLALVNEGMFEMFFLEPTNDELEGILVNFNATARKIKPTIQAKDLLLFLKTPLFVGEEIAKIFEKCKLDEHNNIILQPLQPSLKRQKITHREKDSEEEFIPSGLKLQQVPGAGQCLYHAVALYLADGSDVSALRMRVASYLEAHRADYDKVLPALAPQNVSVEVYIERIRNGEEWGDDLELTILAKVLERPIVIIDEGGNLALIKGEEWSTAEPIFLLLHRGRIHYDALLVDAPDIRNGQLILQELINSRSGLHLSC